MSLVDAAIVRLLPAVPKPVVRRISERYIAGEKLDDALRVVRELNDQGKLATIDVLGEEIAEPDEARAIAAAYRETFEAIERGRLDANVSVKPTALGLKLGYELFRENLLDVVRHAAGRGNFVRIDMEDASTTDDTLRAYRELRESGFDDVGIVLQARLKRTLADLAELAELRPNVRLCKGIYLEPAEIAYRDFDSIRAGFVQALEQLLELGCYVGIATHDEWLVEQGRRLVARARARPGGVRVPDAARSAPGARRQARPKRQSTTDLHAVRRALVRVLVAPAAGEPEDRRLHRRGHGRPDPPPAATASSSVR